MLDYNKILAACDNSSRISTSFVDDFLNYFISEREGLEGKLLRQLGNFRKIISSMPEEWPGVLMSQLIAHRIFQNNGLAGQYVNHVEIRQRSDEELNFFKFQIEHPWRFSFCRIEKDLLHDLYRMKDAISGEEFMLYSPGISRATAEMGGYPSLWLILIGYNGECYQTFGTLSYFSGLQPFDLYFFAKQLNQDIVFLNEVPAMIELNPVPFLMLFSCANVPVTYHKNDMIVFNKSEYYIKDFPMDEYRDDFFIEKKHPIYRLSLKRWQSFPHFVKCYYHAKKNLFILTSMTERGYGTLISALNKHGNDFPAIPDVLCTPAMIYVTDKVLNLDIAMTPYEKHFEMPVSPSEQKDLDKMNVFIESLIDKLNSRKPYDIAEIALKTGISLELAEEIAENLIKKTSNKFRKRKT